MQVISKSSIARPKTCVVTGGALVTTYHVYHRGTSIPSSSFSVYFTKPVQGNLFTKLRSLLMNIDPSSPYGWQDQRSVLGHEPGPDPGVRLTYSEAVQKQSHQTGSSHTRSSNAVNGKVASATPDVKLLWVRLLIVSQLPFPSSQYCLEHYCTSYNTYIRFYLSFVYFI